MRFNALKPFFSGLKAVSLKEELVEQYVKYRLEMKIEGRPAGVTPATINRELATLIRMLGLGYEREKVARMPKIHKLQEAPPRSGFFERDDFEAVRRRLPADIQCAVTIAHDFGWRMQSEVLTLTLSQVDLNANTLRLNPGGSKNGEGRVVYLSDEVRGLVEAQIERVRALSRKLGRVIPFLFPHLTIRHLQGQQIRDFRKIWKSACKKAGLLGMLRHDLRRTATRNMIRTGVPEVVAMKITGHRTRSVFDRYNIISHADLQDAARKMGGGHKTGTFAPAPLDSVTVTS